MKQVILIGDSIRMGYEAFVKQELAGWADVRGPTANGGTSRNVLTHLHEWAFTTPADVIHVNCGLHDLARERAIPGDIPVAFAAAGEPRVVLEEYERNVTRVLGTLRQRPGVRVIWATITPVNEAWHSATKGFERYERDVEAYNAAGLRAARAAGAAVDDLFGFVQQRGRDALLTPDGVHFTPEGSAALGKTVADAIRQAVEPQQVR